MTSPASDLAAELSSRQMARDAKMATDPPVSEAQERAMHAAAAGKSTLGIPKKVGEEFVGKAKDASREEEEYNRELKERLRNTPKGGQLPPSNLNKGSRDEGRWGGRDATGGGSAPEGSEGRYKIVGEPRTKSSRMERALSDLKKPPAKDEAPKGRWGGRAP